MAADLPDLDQSVSFVVDEGQATGPMALAEIARSISAGERPADSYVWWEGEAEWVPFNSDLRLVLLLSNESPDVQSTSDVDADDASDSVVVNEEPVVVDEAVVEEEETVTEAEVAGDADADESAVAGAPVDEVLVDETPVDEVPIEEVEVEHVVAEAPVEMFMAPVIIEVAEEVAPVEAAQPEPLVELDEEIIDVREPAVATNGAATTGVATNGVATDDLALGEIAVAENSVLASVGARLEALTSATRHARTSTQLDRAGALPVEKPMHAKVDNIDLRTHGEDGGEDSEVAGSYTDVSEVRSSTLETQFDSLVRGTVNHERLSEQSERIRELLARACAATISRQGYSVDRRSELQGHYYLRFECGVDTRRMRLEITPTASVGGVSSQNVHVVMSWGRMAFDIEEALEVVQNQLPVADRRPGTISADAELDTGSVSTRVELIWTIDDFVGDDYSINRDALDLALASMQHALEKRWYELFIPAE